MADIRLYKPATQSTHTQTSNLLRCSHVAAFGDITPLAQHIQSQAAWASLCRPSSSGVQSGAQTHIQVCSNTLTPPYITIYAAHLLLSLTSTQLAQHTWASARRTSCLEPCADLCRPSFSHPLRQWYAVGLDAILYQHDSTHRFSAARGPHPKAGPPTERMYNRIHRFLCCKGPTPQGRTVHTA